jgi:hypothetical protein
MRTKVLKLAFKDIPSTSPAGHPIDDPIGSRIDRAYEDPSMTGYCLVAAYETVIPTAEQSEPSSDTYLMLYFQKP